MKQKYKILYERKVNKLDLKKNIRRKREMVCNVLKWIKDQNWNNVIQKCVECIDPSELQFIVDTLEAKYFTWPHTHMVAG